jgi:hypothetical protein
VIGKVLVGFSVLTLALAYPLSVDPASRVLAVAPDTDLFIWTLAWDAHALLTQPFSIFDANIYYPQSRTLAYSENLIGGALFAAPAWWATGNGVLAMNVTALASTVLCGAGAWLLARCLGASLPAAWLAGIIFAFAPPRFLRLSQLHLTLVQWMPFALAFFHSYWNTGRRRDLYLTCLFFTLQALSSGHGAVFLTLAMMAWAIYNFALGEPIALRRRVSDLGLVGAALLVPAALVVLPYLAVQREMQLRRSLADAATWSASAASFLASPTHVHQFVLSQATDRSINDEAWAYLFPGYLPLILAAAAFLLASRTPRAGTLRYGSVWTRVALLLEVIGLTAAGLAAYVLLAGPIRWQAGSTTLLSISGVGRVTGVLVAALAGRLWLARRAPLGLPARVTRWRQRTADWRASRRTDPRWFYGLLLVLTLWLSAAPPVGLWPAVYWLPGLNFIRVASRFTLLGVLCLGVLAALGFDRLADRHLPRRRAAAGVVAGLLMLLEFAAMPLATSAYTARPPAADVWLDTRPKPFSVAEVPVPTAHEGGEERRQTMYMLHSMAHWQKTVHGYSGVRPPRHAELFRQLRSFPDAASVGRLKELGVDYVVVHIDLYQSGEWPAVADRLRQFEGQLILEYDDASARVYRIW